MDQEQLADLVNDIIDEFYFMKIDDFKLCFNLGKRERYGKVFRLDASVILTWLDKYVTDRLNEADELSYNSHSSAKQETTIAGFEGVYKKFIYKK